ncbi:uncharacterized protein LOC121241334 isoform X2 [Juglans microcarpa x Juglans regia]|uniref:uncharacterized protein LOC121241334 isoform X2 n=1 Tax=Juglans microcarpa x Juglans regia TaxID=2249226 RepID=UPI001B7DDA99|nr:uncharacterized protein LOC121241334 isoform X2 [Juglans microcarpa x Juglans regia]
MQFWSSMHGLLVGRKMGSIETVVILIVFSYLCIITTSSPPQKSFPSSGGYVSSSVGDGGTAIARGSRIEGAHGQEAAMVGGSTGNGETGNNGGSRSPSGQGGAALIPVYVAGAANNQHQKHHHGSGNRNRNSIGLSTLVVATLASLLADLYH